MGQFQSDPCWYACRTRAAIFRQPISGDIKWRDAVLGKHGGESMIEYKGYVGVFEFDEELSQFHGNVVNTQDVISAYSRRSAE